MIATTVDEPVVTPAPAVPTSLTAALAEAEAKREADVVRFRTCCADPRASK